jgi:hypothetical protein
MPPDWWLVELIEGADWTAEELEAVFILARPLKSPGSSPGAFGRLRGFLCS